MPGRFAKDILFTLILAVVAESAATAAAPVRPFTLEGVLRDLASTHPHAAAVSTELRQKVRAAEDIVYAQSPAGPLSLDIYRPEDDKQLPAVLIVHGGGWMTGSREMERPLARHLAARGYVTLPASYRLGEAGRFPHAIHDLKAAVRWMRAHASDHGIDPDRIAILGGSAGGTLALFVGATNGDLEYEGSGGWAGHSSSVQAIVDIDGTATFADNALIRASETRPDNPYLTYMHGPFRKSPEIWLKASPLTHVGPSTPPTLFLSSTVTQPILVGREQMFERLTILGIRSRIVVYPDAPHPFWLVQPWFDRVIDDTDAFLRECFDRGGN